MQRSWILQANPKQYAIDDALQALDVIHWRVPQYTDQIQPGDDVLIWRSGAEAGIIGAGKVLELPRQETRPADEAVFDVAADTGQDVTAAAIRLTLVPFVPKADVRSIPEMADHPIVTAPMGTVFPLEPLQWQALLARLPQLPPLDGPSITAEWPSPFAWKERRKSVYPLPTGGEITYLEVLTSILRHVRDEEPGRTGLESWVAQRFDVGATRSSHLVIFFQGVSLLRTHDHRVMLTRDGERMLSERDTAHLLALVHSRVQYVGEMLEGLATPRTTDELLVHANEQYGMGWSSRAQIDRRRQLLNACGVITTNEDHKTARTDLAEGILAQLTVEPPRTTHSPAQVSEPVAPQSAEPTGPASITPAAAPPSATPTVTEVTGLCSLIETLERTSHEADNPDAFEFATADAFRYLGFHSVQFGGAGNTDVLLTAELGRDARYKVIVDTKSTRHETVGDGQIDWQTLDDHQEHYGAEYVALVAPGFQGGRITQRATKGRRVALLDVPALTGMLHQHTRIPLGLDAYRLLFDPDKGPEVVAEIADENRRSMALAAELVRLVTELEDSEGDITSEALYWNTKDLTDALGESPTREEISEILSTLIAPPFAILRSGPNGARSIGSRTSAAARLRLLAELIEQGPTETEAD